MPAPRGDIAVTAAAPWDRDPDPGWQGGRPGGGGIYSKTRKGGRRDAGKEAGKGVPGRGNSLCKDLKVSSESNKLLVAQMKQGGLGEAREASLAGFLPGHWGAMEEL